MPFDHYDRRVHLPAKPTTVCIYAGGSLAIHNATDRAMGRAPYAHLHFDDQRLLIGIDPVWDRTLASYVMSRFSNQGGARIHMRAFLSFLGINWHITQKLHAVFDASRLIIDPSQPANLPITLDRFSCGSFQRFDERRSALRGVSTATIDPKGFISFSKPAFEAMGKPKYVEIYYDREPGRVAVELASGPSGSSFKISTPDDNPHISARNFLAYSQIALDVRTRFTAAMEDGKLVINLRASSVRAIRRRGVAGVFMRDPKQPMLRLVTRSAKAS